MRVVIVPSTLALLPEYASIDDPVPELRRAVRAAVDWLVADGPATALADSPGARRIAAHLLGPGGRAESVSERSVESRSVDTAAGLLVVANGSATRTEKAPGHFDDRAAAFDAAIGKALADGDPAALAGIDLALADELWALPDADVLRSLAGRVGPVTDVQVDYDDAPYGVQYWVVRWQCAS
jgi:hypothetical protein